MSKELDAVKTELYPILLDGRINRAVFIAKVKLSLNLSEAQQWVKVYHQEVNDTVGLIVHYMALHIKKKAAAEGHNECLMQKIWDDAEGFQRRQIDIAYARLLMFEDEL